MRWLSDGLPLRTTPDWSAPGWLSRVQRLLQELSRAQRPWLAQQSPATPAGTQQSPATPAVDWTIHQRLMTATPATQRLTVTRSAPPIRRGAHSSGSEAGAAGAGTGRATLPFGSLGVGAAPELARPPDCSQIRAGHTLRLRTRRQVSARPAHSAAAGEGWGLWMCGRQVSGPTGTQCGGRGGLGSVDVRLNKLYAFYNS